MPNRIRLRCLDCESAMPPVRKGPRGRAFIRVKDVFWCPDDNQIWRGRRKLSFL